MRQRSLKWSDLNANNRVLIQQRLEKELPEYTANQLVSTLALMVDLEFQFNELSTKCVKAFEASLCEAVLHASHHQLLPMLNSLANLHWDAEANSDLCRVILYAVNVHLNALTPLELCDVLPCISKLRIEWAAFHSQLKNSLFSSVSSASVTPSLASSLVMSLASLGVSWSDVPISTKSTLISALVKQVPLSWNSLVDCALGLKQMRVHLDSETIQLVKVLIVQAVNQLSPQLASYPSSSLSLPYRWISFLTSLSYFGITSADLPLHSLMHPLIRHHHSLQSSDLVSLLSALSDLEIAWSSLSDEVQSVLADCVSDKVSLMDTKLYSETVHALALLTFDTEDKRSLGQILLPMHHCILDAFDESYLFLTREQMHQCVVYLTLISEVLPESANGKLCLLSGWFKAKSSNSKDLPPLDYDDKKHVKLNKGLLLQIEQALAANTSTVNYTVVHGYSGLSFSVLPVDGAVFKQNAISLPADSGSGGPGELVGFIEVDGPHHTCATGLLRRKDRLKQRVYGIRHPSVAYLRINGSLTTKADRRNAMKALVSGVVCR